MRQLAYRMPPRQLVYRIVSTDATAYMGRTDANQHATQHPNLPRSLPALCRPHPTLLFSLSLRAQHLGSNATPRQAPAGDRAVPKENQSCAQIGEEEGGRGISDRPGPRGKLSPDAPSSAAPDAPSPQESSCSVKLNSGHAAHMARHMPPSTSAP